MKSRTIKKFWSLPVLLVMLAVMVLSVISISPSTVHAAVLDVSVAASADDTMVSYDSSVWVNYLTNGDIWSGYHSADFQKRGGGFRFQNITIPQGSTITSAYITFTASENKSTTAVNTVLIGEDTDDAATFSTVADYQTRRGTVVGGADNTHVTTASVTWNAISTWVQDTAYNSPDISTIVQEIVNRAGWTSSNDMVIFWDDHAGNSTATVLTYRNAYAYDGSPAKAASLHIEYQDPGSGTIEMGGAASNRSSASTAGYTYILLDSPAGASGKVTTINVYANSGISDLKVGTFYGSGTSYTCRDYVNLGPCAAGAQEFTTSLIAQPISLQVETGDYIGFYSSDNGLDMDTTGGDGVYYATTNLVTGPSDGAQSYTLSSSKVISILATGEALNTIGSYPDEPDGGGCQPNYTRLDLNNSADKTGTITSVTVNSVNALTDLRVGTFYGSGTSWTIRDYEDLGPVATGIQTVSALTISVQAGDILGFYFTTSGSVIGVREPSGADTDGQGLLYRAGNTVDVGGAYTYSYIADTRDQIQGTITVLGEPIVSTTAATSIDADSAQINGTIDSTGGYSVTTRGFQWGLTTGYGNTWSENGTYTAGTFNTTLSGLASGTVYHYRVFATNSQGTAYGEDAYFSTTTSGTEVTPYPGYGYAQQFTIQGSTGGAKSDLQISLHIYKTTGTSSGTSVYLGNNCSSFPNDIIFTGTDGSSVLPFWQETSSSTDVWVWVKIPYVPAYPATTYATISYGNPSQVISLSDGQATWTFFDDFSTIDFTAYGATPVIDIASYCGSDAMIGTMTSTYVNGVWHTYGEVSRNDSGAEYPTGGIFHFTSTDYKNWVIDTSNPVLHADAASSWYRLGFADPTVIYKGGLFYMWLPGNNYTSEPGEKPDVYFGGFTSTDGSSWTELYGDVWPHPHMFSDIATAWDDTAQVWRTWITSWDDTWNTVGETDIQYFYSTDATGSSWTYNSRQTVVLTGYHPMPARVWKQDGTWYMLYFNSDSPFATVPDATDGRIVLATSTNFVNWTTVWEFAQEGYDPGLFCDDADNWYLTLGRKDIGTKYDQEGYNSYYLYTLEGTDLTELSSYSSLGVNWTNGVSSSAYLSEGVLVIDKDNQGQYGVRLTSQLPATCIVGWKIQNLNSGATHYAEGDLINQVGTAQQVAIQLGDTGAGEKAWVYVKAPEVTTQLGTATPGTQYPTVVGVLSQTQVSVLVRGYSGIVVNRTATTNDFLYFGISDAYAYQTVDDVFIGNIVSPTPVITSWGGGSTQYNTISTISASSVSINSAVLNGQITSVSSGHTITYRGFDYGLTTAYSGNWTSAVGSYGLGLYSSSVITGLTGGATYHFRAKMYDNTSVAWTYGTDKTFVTSPQVLPVVATISAASISTTGATLQGSLTSLGDYTEVYASFEYGTSTSYGQYTVEEALTSATTFNYAITGLTKSTTYYFRARIRYGVSSYVNGADQDFTTNSSTSPISSTSVDIEDAVVFTNYLMGGDQLIVISYKCLQGTGEELYNVKDYYSFQVFDGTFLVAQVDVPRWGYGPASIYLSASNSLDGSKEYYLKITGKASKYTSPISDTYAITGGSWGGSDLNSLRTWVLDFADRMGSYYGTTYITYTQIYGRILNEVGSQIFSSTIPSLQIQVPELFSSQSSAIVVTPVDPSKPYEDEVAGGIGATLVAKFDDLGTHLGGLDGTTIAGFIWVLVCIMCIGGAMVVFKTAEPAIFVILPLLLLGGLWGILSLTIIGVTVSALLFFGIYRLLQPS